MSAKARETFARLGLEVPLSWYAAEDLPDELVLIAGAAGRLAEQTTDDDILSLAALVARLAEILMVRAASPDTKENTEP